MKKVNQEAVEFNSPSRKLRLSLLINGQKRVIGFDDHQYSTVDKDEIEAIRELIERQDADQSITKIVFERDKWAEMQAAEPQKIAIEINGQKFEATTSELKEAYLEKLNSKPTLDKPKVIAGTRGSGGKLIKKEGTE